MSKTPLRWMFAHRSIAQRLVALFLLATTLWVIGSRRIAQGQSQTKKARRQYEASPV